jgi:hypothetical protein
MKSEDSSKDRQPRGPHVYMLPEKLIPPCSPATLLLLLVVLVACQLGAGTLVTWLLRGVGLEALTPSSGYLLQREVISINHITSLVSSGSHGPWLPFPGLLICVHSVQSPACAVAISTAPGHSQTVLEGQLSALTMWQTSRADALSFRPPGAFDSSHIESLSTISISCCLSSNRAFFEMSLDV